MTVRPELHAAGGQGGQIQRTRIRLAKPDVGEEELAAIADVFASGMLTKGPWTARFEREFAERHEAAHGVAMANGTVALTATFLALGIGPGDEVIVPSLTFISSATSVMHARATPVFADVDPETFNLDPADVARRVTKTTKAILAVHYGGQPADGDELAAIAADCGAMFIEDAAQAHGASYRGRPVGTLGRAAMFSFTPTKNMTTCEGGVVTTNDRSLAVALRRLRDHGEAGEGRLRTLGYNWRLSEVHAAMGSVQLRKLDAVLERKRANAGWFSKRLRDTPGVQLPVVRPDRTHVYMLYTIVAERRDALLAALRDAGIEARVYFEPLHQLPMFERRPPQLPVTEELSRHILSVPFHSKLERAELEEIARIIESGA